MAWGRFKGTGRAIAPQGPQINLCTRPYACPFSFDRWGTMHLFNPWFTQRVCKGIWDEMCWICSGNIVAVGLAVAVDTTIGDRVPSM